MHIKAELNLFIIYFIFNLTNTFKTFVFFIIFIVLNNSHSRFIIGGLYGWILIVHSEYTFMLLEKIIETLDYFAIVSISCFLSFRSTWQ